jgi:hypothetical protein
VRLSPCYLRLKTFASRPSERAAPASGRGLLGAYASTLLLTLANPTMILSFAAAFTGLGVAAGAGRGYESAGTDGYCASRKLYSSWGPNRREGRDS